MRPLLASLPLLVAVSCSTTQPSETRLRIQAQEASRLEEALSGYTAGAPVRCLPNRNVDGPVAYGDNTLLFRAGRNLIYRNTTHGSCRSVARGDVLITHQYSGQLCQGDIARTADLQTGFQTGACALGEFVPYRRR